MHTNFDSKAQNYTSTRRAGLATQVTMFSRKLNMKVKANKTENFSSTKKCVILLCSASVVEQGVDPWR